MDPVFGDSNTKLNGAAFDLSKCVGNFNRDGSVTLTLVWTPVPKATSYKLIRGGKSPIVLNSIYLNTFLDQAGCFESTNDITSSIIEYTTTSTTYNITYNAGYFTTDVVRAKPSFLVYPYFGKKRGPAPYSVLLFEILSKPAEPIKLIYSRIKSNISVALVEKNLMLKHNVYEYFNHYTNKKQLLTVPSILNPPTTGFNYEKYANGYGEQKDNVNILESAILFYGKMNPSIPIVSGSATSTSITVTFDVAEVGGSNLTFSCRYGITGGLDGDTSSASATISTGTIYECTVIGLTANTGYYFYSVATDSTGSSISEASAVITTLA